MGEIPNFGDLVKNKTLAGEKIKLEDILDRPIIVTGWRFGKSKYQKSDNTSSVYTTIQFYFEDDEKKTEHVTFTGSGVIRDQLEEMEAALEAVGAGKIFRTTVKKISNYLALD